MNGLLTIVLTAAGRTSQEAALKVCVCVCGVDVAGDLHVLPRCTIECAVCTMMHKKRLGGGFALFMNAGGIYHDALLKGCGAIARV